MILLANTVLFLQNDRVDYEILRTQDMLLFKPYFYHLDPSFPCIVLSRFSSGWRFQETVDENIKSQVLKDIQCLKINHQTAPLLS